MKRGFKLQRIGFVAYLLTMVAVAIFAMSFMTYYEGLFGLMLPVNAPISVFYEHMQSFNKVFFWLAIAGVTSIIFMFMLELKTKVCDIFALVVMSLFGALNIGTAIYGYMSLPKLVAEYKTLDFSKMWLEDMKLTEDYVYVSNFTTFYVGYAIFAILILVAIGFIATLWINHFIYKRNEVVVHEEA